MLLKKSNLLTKKETFWKLLTCILDEEFVLSEHQGRTTPPPAKKAKQEIVNSSTVSPYWLEFVQYLIFRLVINSKVKKFVCMYFNCVTFFVWMPKLNFKSWTYYNIDKISQWEQSHYKSQFEFSYYCAFPRFLHIWIWSKNLLKSWKLVWIGLLKWLSPMWGFNQIYNPIFNSLSKDIYRTVFKKHQYDAVLLL